MGGENRFFSNFQHPNRGWILCQNTDYPSGPVLEPYPETTGFSFWFSPQLSDPTKTSIDLNDHYPAPILDNFSWDWIEFHYQPLKDLMVRSLYWVPDPGVICGKSWIINHSDQSQRVVLDLACRLQSQGVGSLMILEDIKGRPVLTGNLGEQSLFLFLARDPVPRAGPHPYLQTTLSLAPMEETKVQWICVLADTKPAALEILEQVIQLDWPGEISRRKVALQGHLKISTGDPDWDFALALSQKQAQLKYQQLTSRDHPETSRNIEITPFQALFLLHSIQPLTPGSVKNILDLVFRQDTGQKHPEKNSDNDLTPPLLAAELLWEVHRSGYDPEIWSDYLPAVNKWLKGWFSTKLDKDRDGIPELTCPLILDLAGVEIDDLSAANQLIPYPYLESPGLGALIYNDLCKMDELVKISETSIDFEIQEKKGLLLEFLRETWNSENGRFQNRDSQSHIVINGFAISEDIQPGLNILRADLQQPTRIGVQHRRFKPDQAPGEFTIIFHGQDLRGNSRVEEVHSMNFTWGKRFDWGITESIFLKLDFCTLKCSGLEGELNLVAPSTTGNDLTLTLPLWADVLPDDQAQSFIQNVLLDSGQYWTPYGFSSMPGGGDSIVQSSWNLLLGQALMRYGKLKQSAELIDRWMAALVPSVSGSGIMYPAYHARTGEGMGQKDSLESLFPVRFFLQVLGIEFLEDRYITIQGENPFPWPVKLSYRGVIIERGKHQTTIFRPGKELITLTGPDKFQLDLG